MIIYVGLVHYPVKDKCGYIVATSITNLDVHDISRSCTTFAIKRFFLINPLVEQQEITKRLLTFWQEESSLIYNPDRYQALKVAQLVDSIEDGLAIIRADGYIPQIAVTGASLRENVTLAKLKNSLLDKEALFLLFGTGWGLSDQIVDAAKYILPPILGCNHYNHL